VNTVSFIYPSGFLLFHINLSGIPIVSNISARRSNRKKTVCGPHDI